MPESLKQRVLALIKQGENSAVEFKESAVRKESIAKEMVAFSNTFGGSILIGISDQSQISGLNAAQNDIEEWVMNIARNNVIPSISPQLSLLKIDGKIICLIEVNKGKNKPYQTNENKYLVRVGSTNRTATQLELMRLFQQSGFFHYDLIGVTASSIKDLNFTAIDNFFDRYDIDFTNESETEKVRLLQNSDILTEAGECTVAGLLIFASNPQRRLQNASISVARFRGNQINAELIDSKVIEGPLPIQVDTATALVKSLIPISSNIKENKRVDTQLRYSDKVYRELIVNAVVHRNYSIEGSRIRIFIFDNRIEITSPGRLPNTVNTEKIKVGVSYASNPILVKFMENMRYIDKLGRGIPMVCTEAKKLQLKVEFQEIGEEFSVTLWF